MKKNLFTLIAVMALLNCRSQLVVADFESFSLTPNSYYVDTLNTPFYTQNAGFQHKGDWNWSGGFSYSNVHDSSTAGFTNKFAAITYNGYNNSDTYVMCQLSGLISLASAQNTVEGFYITNSTYAYKSILSGDAFARKFGDTTGTGTGGTNTQGSYPDFFKVTFKGYDNGLLKPDSVEFYLADYRNPNNNLDYVVDSWQWVNTSVLGEVDSLRFFMYSSDVGPFGINTPLYFAIDNFTTKGQIIGVEEEARNSGFTFFPNPCKEQLFFRSVNNIEFLSYKIFSNSGALLRSGRLSENEQIVEVKDLPMGIYHLEWSHESTVGHQLFIKE